MSVYHVSVINVDVVYNLSANVFNQTFKVLLFGLIFGVFLLVWTHSRYVFKRTTVN